MKTAHKTFTAILAIAVLTLALASVAKAECGSYVNGSKFGARLQPQSWEESAFGSASLLPIADTVEPVVGFWKVKLIAEDSAPVPDGAVIDEGYAEWHSDGTEILNSSRPPSTGSFCLGVWKKVATSKYVLNHFAISWDASGNLVGPANIREQVTVGPGGARFTGTFDLTQYDQLGNVLAHIQGKITGKRINVNTTIGDVL